MMRHLTRQQIRDHAERISPPEVASHLRECEECRSAVRFDEDIARALRQLPLEEVPDGFADVTLRRLGITPGSSFAWNLLTNFAPVFGLVLVGAAVFGVLWYSGVLGETGTAGAAGQAQPQLDSFSRQLTGSVSALNAWINTYLSFAFARNRYLLTTFIIVLFAAVAVLDRYVLMPILRKRIRALR